MTRAQLMARMSGSEFQEWMAFDQIEPFGDRRADLLCGILGSIMANLHGRAKDDPAFTPDMFMPKFDPEPEEVQDTAEQQRRLESFLSWPNP